MRAALRLRLKTSPAEYIPSTPSPVPLKGKGNCCSSPSGARLLPSCGGCDGVVGLDALLSMRVTDTFGRIIDGGLHFTRRFERLHEQHFQRGAEDSSALRGIDIPIHG